MRIAHISFSLKEGAIVAFAMDVRELDAAEIDVVAGAGIFEKIGEALDNPFTTAGKIIDYIGMNGEWDPSRSCIMNTRYGL